MVSLGRYPKPDPEYQKFYYEQVNLAKNRISHFPLTNKLFCNFKNYENQNYKESRNKIFLSCIHKINWINPGMLYGVQIDPEEKPIKYFTNNLDYPENVELLEKSLSQFKFERWNNDQLNSFKNRITSNDYFKSNSAFIEITTAFRIGFKVGLDNIEYEPPVYNGKNSDVKISINNKQIYLELSSITESVANKKIQSILDTVAKYLFKKMNTESVFQFSIWLDTTQLIHTNDHIDEEKSKKFLLEWVDKLHLDQLLGANGLLPLSEYRLHSGISEYSDHSLINYPWHRPPNKKLLDEDPAFHKWASKIQLSDAIFGPFASIGCSNKDEFSVVEIHEDSSHSTHEELVNSNRFSDLNTGRIQEKSFFNQIKRKIMFKINEEQFVRGSPIVFVINGRLWSNSFETDNQDFSQIKKIIEDLMSSYSYISGVLLYDSDYVNGGFIHNTNAEKNIKLSESEISLIFCKTTISNNY